MATKFPLQLNNLRFYVNPTGLQITKGITFGTLPTQGGVKYQVWYDTPDVLNISGACAGSTAYRELLFLKTQFERTNKVSELFYKTRLYRGMITNLVIDHNTSHINEFTYTITFQLLFGGKFAVEDFSINATNQGVLSSTLQKLANFINAPLNKLESSITQALSKGL